MTIQDVAKKAGVSAATVSRVINGSGSVHPKTAEHVTNIINILGYQPNHIGRQLRKKETKTILVMVSTVSNTLISKVISGIEQAGRSLGYYVLIGTTNDKKEREETVLSMIKQRLADGMIIMNTLMNKEQLQSLGAGINIIQCCEYIYGTNVAYVAINNRKAAYEAVKHLLKTGRRKIAYIGVKNHLISSSQRFLGYCDALEEFGITINEKLISNGNYGFRSAMKIMDTLFEKGAGPDALFAISDRMAAGAIRAIKDKGLKVPEDIAVAGFDNTDISYISEPGITSVSQQPEEMGKQAMILLDKKIKGEEHMNNVIIRHEMVLRESTKI